MKRSVLLLIALLTGLAVTGCSTTSVSQSDELELQKPIVRVCDLHDAGVNRDAILTPEDKVAALADSYILRHAFDNAGDIYLPPVVAPGKRVCARHNDYALSDPNLSPTAKKVAYERAKAVEEMLDAVKRPTLPIPPAPPNTVPASPPATTRPASPTQPSSDS